MNKTGLQTKLSKSWYLDNWEQKFAQASKFSQKLVKIWSKSGQNLKNIWSKFEQYLVKIWSKFEQN